MFSNLAPNTVATAKMCQDIFNVIKEPMQIMSKRIEEAEDKIVELTEKLSRAERRILDIEMQLYKAEKSYE